MYSSATFNVGQILQDLLRIILDVKTTKHYIFSEELNTED
jgi:hypothetical protein